MVLSASWSGTTLPPARITRVIVSVALWTDSAKNPAQSGRRTPGMP